MKRTCTDCGRITEAGQLRCAQHAKPKQRTWRGGPTGGSNAWRNIRKRVLKRDGYQCTAVINGARCAATTNLAVHHLTPDGGVLVPDALLATVCSVHHAQVHARA